MKTLLYISGLIMTLCFSACNQQGATSDAGYSRVSNSEWRTALSNAENPLILDVRTPGEFAEGALEGAYNIDFLSGDFEAALPSMDTTRTVFVYCRSGGRSAKAADMLHHQGFDHIIELKEGYSGWDQK